MDILETFITKAFVNSLSVNEAELVRSPKKLLPSFQSNVLDVLSHHACQDVPNTSNLKKMIINASNFIFIVKPSLAILLMNRGISEKHCQFWLTISIEELHDIYNVLSVSAMRQTTG